MRRSQELTIKISEARERLNKAIEKRNALGDKEPDGELLSEMDAASKALPPLEIEYRAAVQAEAAEDEAATRDNPDSEMRERQRLEGQCSVTAFMAEAVADKPVKGAEAEYRAAELGDNAAEGFMPLRLLAEPQSEEQRTEKRAVTPVADAATGLGSQSDIMGRVFERSIAAQLGVAMPAVPMGTRTWPILTGGTTVSQQAPSGEQAAVAGTFAGTELSPRRLTGSYEFRVEDLSLLRGLEPALRRDLRALITDQMDQQILNGDGTDPNVNGFFAKLGDPDAATGLAGHTEFVAAFTGMVDGKHAYSHADVRAIIGNAIFARLESVYRSTHDGVDRQP